MEADMRVIVATIAGLISLAAIAVEAPPNSDPANWHPLGAVLSFTLGDQACTEGSHQALRRDWRGDWWWGPCTPNR
jgi:hypothetical protein